MLRKLVPTVIGYLLGNELQPVSPQNRLPTEPKPANADPLLTATVTVDTNPNRDILGNTSSDESTAAPTLSECGQYHTLIWTGVKTGAADIDYIVQARSTDINSGEPLANGWFTVTADAIKGVANSWFRIVITAPGGLYWDQYRIRVQQASGTQVLISKVVGVRH